MATLLQAIGEILRPELVQRGPIVLQEDDPGSTCKAITLHKSGQAIVLRPDQPERLFPLFREIPDLRVMCDYIVFCQETSANDAPLFVLLCELKSDKIAGSRQQIENGRLLADYVLEMALHHHTIRPRPPIERRGLVFSPKFSVPKGNLRQVRCSYSHLPNGFPDMPFAYYRADADYPLCHFCA